MAVLILAMLLAIATNEAHFIIIYKIYTAYGSTDVKELKPILDKIARVTYGREYKITGLGA